MSNNAGRSIWNGSIAFGMVVIPVKLYTATDTHDTSFRQVHRADGGRVQFRRFCSLDGEEVPFPDIAKGYEHADGSVTVLTDDDMKNLPLSTSKAMEVLQFVDPAKIDPLMFGKAYYALPASPAGNNAFTMLVKAMQRRKVAGLVKVALRQRETLGLLTERDGSLALTLLLWPDEVREAPKPDPVTALNDKVIEQATGLIDIMTSDFIPSDHTDAYAAAVNELVEAKIAGKPAAPAGVPTAAGPPADLSDMLKASVAAAKGSKSTAKKGAKKS
jgi:DNA end-binding protein Ku